MMMVMMVMDDFLVGHSQWLAEWTDFLLLSGRGSMFIVGIGAMVWGVLFLFVVLGVLVMLGLSVSVSAWR